MSKIYGIIIKEIFAKAIAVKADSLEEALVLVNKEYDSEKIILTASDHDDTYIYPCPDENENGTIRQKNIKFYCEQLNF